MSDLQFEIQQLRQQIDQVDFQLALLIDQRLNLAKSILLKKAQLGLTKTDPEREEEIFQQVEKIARLQNPASVQKILSQIIAEGKTLV